VQVWVTEIQPAVTIEGNSRTTEGTVERHEEPHPTLRTITNAAVQNPQAAAAAQTRTITGSSVGV
jgi:hypothetical protein